MNKKLPEHVPIITIDGPSGAGKGTVSQILASTLGWHFLDSGALYRIVAYWVAENQIDIGNEINITNVINDLKVEFRANPEKKQSQVWVNGKRVEEAIRTEVCGLLASKLSTLKPVRQGLVALQHHFRQAPGLIADGRDMGTAIFPDADLKFFLDACCEERAKRRYNQLKEKGISANLGRILEDLTIRDERDRQRAESPLRPADDAVQIDTTHFSINHVVSLMMERVVEAGLQ